MAPRVFTQLVRRSARGLGWFLVSILGVAARAAAVNMQ
jgi:hypothetical protein